MTFIKIIFVFVSIFTTSVWALPSMDPPQVDSSRMDSETPPQEFDGVGISEKLGTTLDFSGLNFVTARGESVNLGQYFHQGKPVMLVLAYYTCSNLCNLLLGGMSSAVRMLDYDAGNQYEIVAVSFNHRDQPSDALKKKEFFLKEYGRQGGEQGWHFLTGDEATIKRLTDQVGFTFKWDEESNQYAHASALMLVSPEGMMSRYLHGISFKTSDVKLGLIEAGQGKIGSILEQALMFCFRYDPTKKGYAVYAYNIVKTGAGLMIILLFSYLFWFWYTELRKKVGQQPQAS